MLQASGTTEPIPENWSKNKVLLLRGIFLKIQLHFAVEIETMTVETGGPASGQIMELLLGFWKLD